MKWSSCSKAFGEFFKGSGPAFQALFHQGRANSLVCALLIREMTKAGLIDPHALEQEALAAAEGLEPPGSGAGVAKVITSIFGGEPAEIPPSVALRVIQGGLDLKPQHGKSGETRDDDGTT